MPSQRSIALCRACENNLPHNHIACQFCALPLTLHLPETARVCAYCQRRPPLAPVTVAPCLYTEPVAGLLWSLKYRGDFRQPGVFSHLMLNPVIERICTAGPPDLAVPMPLHWWRHWRRGFNQAELLATSLSRQLRDRGWSIKIDKRLCCRNKATRPQVELDATERQSNLRGAMACRRTLHGERVAIIDDVVTTGASAWSLASTLLAAGAGTVEIWCCARTPQAAGQVH
jgi:ComF family protein